MSSKTKIKYFHRESFLENWLKENEVLVLDIKFAIDSDSSNPEKFMVIYTEV